MLNLPDCFKTSISGPANIRSHTAQFLVLLNTLTLFWHSKTVLLEIEGLYNYIESD